MRVPINVKSPDNTSKWQMGFNSAFKGLTDRPTYKNALVVPRAGPTNVTAVPAVSVFYHKTGLFCVLRLAPSTSIGTIDVYPATAF